MPVDSEKVKKAIDAFVDDDYIESKEILKKEIKKAKNDWLKDKLELDNDVEDVEPEEDTEDTEDTEEENTEEEEWWEYVGIIWKMPGCGFGELKCKNKENDF